jgi:hypothetical protein
MADKHGTQTGEERPYVLREGAFPFGLPERPPGTKLDYRVKIYEDENRYFTYLNETFLTPQQKRVLAPTIFTAVLAVRQDYRRAPQEVTLQQVPKEMTMSNGVNYILREVELARMSSFAIQTWGCNVAYVEDRAALPYLLPLQRARATQNGATLVRTDPLIQTRPAPSTNQPQSSNAQSTQSEQQDPPTAEPSSRP